jgi:hypothetical protein
MTKSKFFRVAVEGATVDGRVIDRKWLEEMAATYNRATYGARINLEHIRGAVPLSANAPFGSYGDVLSVKTEIVDIELGGKTEKRLALFAEIEALDPLIELIKKGQKLYTSIEVNPAFAGTGMAYLMGIAATDNPASLGTDILEFSAKLGDKGPLAARKQQPGNFFSVATETTIELVDDQQTADPTGVFGAIKSLLDRFTPATPAPAPQPEPKPEDLPQPGAQGGVEFAAAFGAAMGQMAGAVNKLATDTGTALTAIRGEVSTLKEQISATPATSHHSRPLATGAEAQFVKTDC